MMNKIRKLREKKGFTLVELIVVIAIIAILTAVLVPLINNWTQQAAYTTLNDGAQTVSNSVNEAISKVIAGGSPLSSSITAVTGTKSAEGENNLSITVGSATCTADETTFKAITNPTVEQKIAYEIAKMLDATMPGTSAFYAAISNGAVTGIIYTTSSATAPAGTETIKAVDGFDGYEIDGGSAVGVTGKYKV